MNSITTTNNAKTTLSVEKGKLTLCIGKDVNPDKSKVFLDTLEDILEEVDLHGKPFYGHFSFSKDNMEVKFSSRKEEPMSNDITYKRRL